MRFNSNEKDSTTSSEDQIFDEKHSIAKPILYSPTISRIIRDVTKNHPDIDEEPQCPGGHCRGSHNRGCHSRSGHDRCHSRATGHCRSDHMHHSLKL